MFLDMHLGYLPYAHAYAHDDALRADEINVVSQVLSRARAEPRRMTCVPTRAQNSARPQTRVS